MDAHRADDLVGGDAEQRQGDDRDRTVVDCVAVVAVEEALLVAKYLAPQRRGPAPLPALGREFDLVFATAEIGQKGSKIMPPPPARRSRAQSRRRSGRSRP